MDRDQAPPNVGPGLQSILFDNQYNFLLGTVCFAWNDLSYLSILQIVQKPLEGTIVNQLTLLV